jgi:hypothetical protein
VLTVTADIVLTSVISWTKCAVLFNNFQRREVLGYKIGRTAHSLKLVLPKRRRRRLWQTEYRKGNAEGLNQVPVYWLFLFCCSALLYQLLLLEYHDSVGNSKRIPLTQGRHYLEVASAWNTLCNTAVGTGCFTRYDAKSLLPGATQNIIRNIQYRVLSKVQFDLKQ